MGTGKKFPVLPLPRIRTEEFSPAISPPETTPWRIDYLVHVRNHAACQLVQTGIVAHHFSIVILGLKGNGVLYHRSIGRHIGEENQRQTSRKHTRTSTYFQRLVRYLKNITTQCIAISLRKKRKKLSFAVSGRKWRNGLRRGNEGRICISRDLI